MFYADFFFYGGTYRSDKMNSEAFYRLMPKASAVLNEITLGKIKDVTEDIKLAACAIADEMYSIECICAESHSGSITSEKTGDVSISYNASVISPLSNEAYRRYYLVAKMYINDKRLFERWNIC